jgi:hypothetical protein
MSVAAQSRDFDPQEAYVIGKLCAISELSDLGKELGEQFNRTG